MIYPYILNKVDETPVIRVRAGAQTKDVINNNLLFRVLKAKKEQERQG